MKTGTNPYVYARSEPSGNGGRRFPQILDLFSGFENWSFQWLSRENLDFQKNND